MRNIGTVIQKLLSEAYFLREWSLCIAICLFIFCVFYGAWNKFDMTQFSSKEDSKKFRRARFHYGFSRFLAVVDALFWALVLYYKFLE